MHSHRLGAVLSATAIGFVMGCTSSPYTPESFEPVALDTSDIAPKVDAFVVALDASSSMAGKYRERQKFHVAQDFVANLNQTVPPLAYDAALLAFGTGPCMESQPIELLYGPAPYDRTGFAAGLESIECAGGTTPMAAALSDSRRIIAAGANPLAVFLVSDFQNTDTGTAVAAATRLKEAYGENVCLHAVQIGSGSGSGSLVGDLSGMGACDSSTNADDVATPAAMVAYLEGTLFGPLEYSRTTVSATALFDFNSAVLKEQGKAELQVLGGQIRSQGARVADIDVIGYTDGTGSPEYNQELSVKRAMAVKDYLVSQGVDAGIIDVSGRGQEAPVASNETAEGRAMNRRVDILVGVAGASS